MGTEIRSKEFYRLAGALVARRRTSIARVSNGSSV